LKQANRSNAKEVKSKSAVVTNDGPCRLAVPKAAAVAARKERTMN
jgi:hypothetical protein